MSGNSVRFLLVEKNEDHAELIRQALITERIANELLHFESVDHCWACLEEELKKKRSPKNSTDVILLNVDPPELSGFELLRKIKNNVHLKHIPVILLAAVDSEQQRQQAYAEHANSFVVKPIDSDKFETMIKDLGFYWGIWNKLPPE